MKVLALTHAHLTAGGLSPVSCERADSLVSVWSEKLHWNIDVVHTRCTKWRGIWPGGKGLLVNILDLQAPKGALIEEAQLFSVQLKKLLAQKNFIDAGFSILNRLYKRLQSLRGKNAYILPDDFKAAAKWGKYLSRLPELNKKYNFLFVTVGYGDEYLLETALILSEKLNTPMVVDFRDFWSDHHDPGRFNENQKKEIRRYEKKLLVNTRLISVPQQHMVNLLKAWSPCPVFLLSHSAYKDENWKDGEVVNKEFRMLYAGKLYADGPGLGMLLELIKRLKTAGTEIPLLVRFFVDDTRTLNTLAASYGIADAISVNEWISPASLWSELRSAHLLLIPDSGVAENYPLLPTKTYQYAYTGRQILCLLEFSNEEMEQYLAGYNAGKVCYNVEYAVSWVKELVKEKTQYLALPPLRNITTREEMAIRFGREIEKVID